MMLRMTQPRAATDGQVPDWPGRDQLKTTPPAPGLPPVHLEPAARPAGCLALSFDHPGLRRHQHLEQPLEYPRMPVTARSGAFPPAHSGLPTRVNTVGRPA